MAEIFARVKRKPSQSPLDAFWLEMNKRPLKRPLPDFADLSISDSAQQVSKTNVAESSPAWPPSEPVFVRVKRKPSQSPLDAFWLEINKRPPKRPLRDFTDLSICGSAQKVEFHNKKISMQHVETISSSEATFDIVQSIVDSGSSRASESKSKIEERKTFFKIDNCARKQDQFLFKAKQDKESLAKDFQFRQIWKSRKGNKEAEHEKALLEICNLYDVVRVDEKIKDLQQEYISLADKRLLSSFLPLLREVVPIAASEIEESYVYDLYTVKDEMDVEDSSCSYPFIQVDEEDFYDGPDEDPVNDYPDEQLEHHTVSRDADDESYVDNFGPDEDFYDGPDEDPVNDYPDVQLEHHTLSIDVADQSFVENFGDYGDVDGEDWR